jgi:hypothetical protein
MHRDAPPMKSRLSAVSVPDVRIHLSSAYIPANVIAGEVGRLKMKPL